ncbi:secretin N-terminal domain-containing protein [Vibrio parahaemolyticus]|uniref:secretin N-terminal domain-containing protein n=1 Tax=Vibrio parahaemolyticus TaxID=670 RepID=UPI0007A0AC4A|nr:secretin N-terminal domain-containing protein [Vibrio parahaemolyticus]EIW7482440.1 secretin [Vibrio parahaemolyticus]KYX40248.1 secretin [Vibrio parahaemolyticus]HCH3718655.1 secretin [Vibrio parahaemolyticus]
MYRLILLVLCCLTFTVQADVMIKQQDMNLIEALDAIAKDMQLKLASNLDTQTQNQPMTQTLSGPGPLLLSKLSKVFDFDWYTYGGTLTIQSGQEYINYTYKPRNISPELLLRELKLTFKTNETTKIRLVERGHSILFSGTKKFVNDAVAYAGMVDKNHFLERGNNLELARIEFHYISVLDRNIATYDGQATFPGAQSLIAAAITNIGQFKNISDGELVSRAYKVKLSEGDRQNLDEEEKTTNVQALPGSNALLVRGTPDEVKLAKRIAALIDTERRQLLFSLKVYDVSAERKEHFGVDSSWVNGSRGVYDLVVPPFTETIDFLRNFQALASNGIARGVYETNLLALENQQGHFGKKQTATIALISNKQVETQKIEADNSLYVTGRLLPSGDVQARIQYIEESLDDDEEDSDNSNRPPRVSSQSLNSEVYIKPGQTIILGGFDNTVTQQTESGIPVLSSIPLLGELFKSTSEVKSKYKRYVSISFQVIE